MDSIVEEGSAHHDSAAYAVTLGAPIPITGRNATIDSSVGSSSSHSAGVDGMNSHLIPSASPERRYRSMEERWAAYERGLASKPLPPPPTEPAPRLKKLSLENLRRASASKGKSSLLRNGSAGWRSAESLGALRSWDRDGGPSSSTVTLTPSAPEKETSGSHLIRRLSVQRDSVSDGPPSTSSVDAHAPGSIPSGSRIIPSRLDSSSRSQRASSHADAVAEPSRVLQDSPIIADQEHASPDLQGAGAATFGVRTHSSLPSVRTVASVSSQASRYSEVSPSVNRPYSIPFPSRHTSLLPADQIYSRLPLPPPNADHDSNPILEGEGDLPDQREPGDRYLRSQPGIIGLGEGWAGGPQPKKKNKYRWSMKKQGPEEPDPLALWAIDENPEASGSTRSPLKELWNKSRSMLAGGHADRSFSAGQKKGNTGSGLGRVKGFFSRSRLDLAAQDDEQDAKLEAASRARKQKNRRSVADFFSFSRSTLDLRQSSKSSTNLPGKRSTHRSDGPRTPDQTPRPSTTVGSAASPAQDYFIDSPVSRSKREDAARSATPSALVSTTSLVHGSVEDLALRRRSVGLPPPPRERNSLLPPVPEPGGEAETVLSLNDGVNVRPVSNVDTASASAASLTTPKHSAMQAGQETPGFDTLASWAEEARDAPRPFGSAINDRAARRQQPSPSEDHGGSVSNLRSRLSQSAQGWRSRSRLTSLSEMNLSASGTNGNHHQNEVARGTSFRALATIDKLRAATASPTHESINALMERYEGARMIPSSPSLPKAPSQPTLVPLRAPEDLSPQHHRAIASATRSDRRRSWFGSSDAPSRRVSWLLEESGPSTTAVEDNSTPAVATPRPSLLARLRSSSRSASRPWSQIYIHRESQADIRPYAAASTSVLPSSLTGGNYVISHPNISDDSLGLNDIIHPADLTSAAAQLNETAKVFPLPPASIPEMPGRPHRERERVKQDDDEARDKQANRRVHVFEGQQWAYGIPQQREQVHSDEVAHPGHDTSTRSGTINTSSTTTDSPDPVTPKSAHSSLSLAPPVPPKTPQDLPAAYNPVLLLPGTSNRTSVADSFHTAATEGGTASPPSLGLGSRTASFVSAGQGQEQFFDAEEGMSTPVGMGGMLGLTPTSAQNHEHLSFPFALDASGKHNNNNNKRQSWLSVMSDQTALTIGSADDALAPAVLQEARPMHVGEMIEDQGRRPSLVDLDDIRAAAARVQT